MKKPLMAGNWKMNKTVLEAIEFTKTLKNTISDIANVEVLICPAFTALYAVSNEIRGSNINLGSQNFFWESKGAFTGEISPVMIKDVGCSYVIIGHSERRQYFAETNEAVNKKIKAAFTVTLKPIVCVGETLKEREDNVTSKVIEKQIREGLFGLTLEQASSVVIAYEPVWAIGTGKTASPDQAQEIHHFIRKIYEQMYSKDISNKLRILYGGSVNSKNVSDLMNKPDIDGGLVGGASLEVESFTKLIRYFK
ncbi:MAG: triose-phosphate isomerase [Endomicrobium sp.]|jgi:triosephosphate isomerase|nr:triose-phosphate isomerase [Endomicrobium sp.]